ncbi:MAG: 5,10-methylenetetrahydrofolate reductase [bacterium]|nr:5,10-methylenetetrahydrofolate reductase [bacterium]
MIVTDIWQAAKRPTVSCELFPPRTEKAAGNLDKAIAKLAAMGPDFVSVTFGAGGSTRDGSRRLVQQCLDLELAVLPYFSCYGLGPEAITSVLGDYRDLGIESLLLVRGDAPRNAEDFTPHPDSFTYASDLLPFVGDRFDFCLGAAGYPEGHPEAENLDRDIEILKLKVERGARFIIANYFWDNDYFFGFLDRCAAAAINVPIIPGVMPIYGVKLMENLAKLSGATIPPVLRAGVDAVPAEDRAAMSVFGIEYALRQCRGLLERGVPGLHFYTMDRAKATVSIVETLRSEGLL